MTGFSYLYDPSIAGNAVLLGSFALLMPLVLVLGFRYQTYVWSTTVATGLSLEIIGLVGRILLHSDRHSETYLFLSVLGSVLGPTFACEAIWTTLPHLFRLYGQNLGLLLPCHAEVIFFMLNAAVVLLQLVGIIWLSLGFNGITVCASNGKRLFLSAR